MDLTFGPVMQELEEDPTICCIRPYQHTIRNGIAHGGITFLQDEIRYRDKKGNEEQFSVASIVRLFDDLLDTCNGLAAALKVFLLVSRDRGYLPPRELLVEELQEESSTPWWTIEGCVQSQVADKSQLIVYARPNSRHYPKVQWSTIQSGILAEYFAPGYDRYSSPSDHQRHGLAGQPSTERSCGTCAKPGLMTSRSIAELSRTILSPMSSATRTQYGPGRPSPACASSESARSIRTTRS